MARPIKDGFDYFPFDVVLDRKVQSLETVFKNNGFVWIVKFWQTAYQSNSGEVSLQNYYGVIQAENSRITLEEQQKIVEMCVDIGLIYEKRPGIYSSKGIEKRIDFLVTERKRWRNKNKNELSPGITHITTVLSPEIRGESKVKETKGNIKETNTAFFKKINPEKQLTTINGQPINYGLWLTVYCAIGKSEYDTALILYRAKVAHPENIQAYIIAGLRDKYIFNPCKDEDENPVHVKNWVERFLNHVKMFREKEGRDDKSGGSMERQTSA